MADLPQFAAQMKDWSGPGALAAIVLMIANIQFGVLPPNHSVDAVRTQLEKVSEDMAAINARNWTAINEERDSRVAAHSVNTQATHKVAEKAADLERRVERLEDRSELARNQRETIGGDLRKLVDLANELRGQLNIVVYRIDAISRQVGVDRPVKP